MAMAARTKCLTVQITATACITHGIKHGMFYVFLFETYNIYIIIRVVNVFRPQTLLNAFNFIQSYGQSNVGYIVTKGEERAMYS